MSAVTVVLLAASTIVLASVVTGGASRSIAPCRSSDVRFVLHLNAGMGHGSYLVDVHNLGTQRCELTGYPTVRVPLASRLDRSMPASLQRVVRRGATAAVRDRASSYAGGYVGPAAAPAAIVLPTVVLAPRVDVASFTLVWLDMATSQRPCPMATSIEVGIAASIELRSIQRTSFVCSVVDVTPFVRGPSGQWR